MTDQRKPTYRALHATVARIARLNMDGDPVDGDPVDGDNGPEEYDMSGDDAYETAQAAIAMCRETMAGGRYPESEPGGMDAAAIIDGWGLNPCVAVGVLAILAAMGFGMAVAHIVAG